MIFPNMSAYLICLALDPVWSLSIATQAHRAFTICAWKVRFRERARTSCAPEAVSTNAMDL